MSDNLKHTDNPKPTDDLKPHQTTVLADDLFGWTPPSVERYVPGVGPTYVHGYTGADAAKWRQAARNMARGSEPTPEQYAVAHVLWVCRTAPGGADHTFKVSLQDARRAFERMMEALPGKWVETACHESDALSLQGYFPQDQQGPSAAGISAEAQRRLGELLADEECWAALSTLSLKLYGVPLGENRRPMGEVLMHLRPEMSTEERLGLES